MRCQGMLKLMNGPRTKRPTRRLVSQIGFRRLPRMERRIAGNTQGQRGEYITQVAGHQRSAMNRLEINIPATAIAYRMHATLIILGRHEENRFGFRTLAAAIPD